MVLLSLLPTALGVLQYPLVHEHYALVKYQLGQQLCEHRLRVQALTWLQLHRLSLL